ncbi:MAG: ATPase [Bacteroidetes bacterium]|nr:ATPase [Bacteroidota bacterium]
MILLVDSGSTKSEWLLVTKSGEYVNIYNTIGFNPVFQSSDFIENEIKENGGLMGIADSVDQVFYYGAGCSGESYQKVVFTALTRIFRKAKINVDHDIMAAAYASYEGTPCICCILGTGSNSAYFDGREVYSVNAGLGYILGDEGSGSYFGKKLLAAFLYKQLPDAVLSELEAEFHLDRAGIIKMVYQEPRANVYLASFTRFIAKHRDLPVFEQMLYEGMREFLHIHVCCFPEYKEVKTHFVGSIAFYFSDSIRRAAADLGIEVGQIMKSPIHRMLDYHIQYFFQNA